jgi:two-component system, probable response regulator PhcQ
MTKRLLILDDEPGVLSALQRTLRRCFAEIDMKIETFTDPEDAILRCADVDFDVVISDYHMPAFSGVDFFKMLKNIQPHAVRVVLSGSTQFDVVVNAVNQGEVFRYLAKPWDEHALCQILQLAFEHAARLRTQATVNPKAPLSPQESEMKRLENEEPGITHVKWRPDGSIEL